MSVLEAEIQSHKFLIQKAKVAIKLLETLRREIDVSGVNDMEIKGSGSLILYMPRSNSNVRLEVIAYIDLRIEEEQQAIRDLEDRLLSLENLKGG